MLMKSITKHELRDMISEHTTWLDTAGRLGKQINLSRRVVRGVNLSGRNLSKGIFVSTRFYDVKLKEAKFTGANLERAYLGPTNLSKVSFKKANLTRTNFKEAILNSTNFHGAKFNNTNFEGTLLSNALFDDDMLRKIKKRVVESMDNKTPLVLTI